MPEEFIGIYVNEKAVFAACSYGGFRILDHSLGLISSVSGIEGRCWTILERNGFLFAAVGQGGIYVYDVKNLKKPILVNRLKAGDARDIVIQGSYLYTAAGQEGLLVYDISDVKDIKYNKKIPSAAFTRGIMVDESYIYKADGDGGIEVYEK